MADTTAGLIKSSVLILMLSTVSAEKFRHNRSSLVALHHRFLYQSNDLKKNEYLTMDNEVDYNRRYPNLYRVRNKVTKPKLTTSSSSVSEVIMIPWLQTEDPFRMDKNGALRDGVIPETKSLVSNTVCHYANSFIVGHIFSRETVECEISVESQFYQCQNIGISILGCFTRGPNDRLMNHKVPKLRTHLKSLEARFSSACEIINQII